MALIIDPTADNMFYDSVRRLLGGVDEDTLPDEDISDPTILDMAEIQVIDLIPHVELELLSPSDKAKVRLATIHIMASMLCPTMPSRIDIDVKTIDISWKRKPVDYSQLAETLFARALDLLNQLDGATLEKVMVFSIAPSKRAVSESNEES